MAIQWKKHAHFYLPDLIGIIIVIAIGLGFTNIKPYDRFFVERDPTLSYPYIPANQNEIPAWSLVFFAILIPCLSILLVQLARWKFSFFDKFEATPMNSHLLLPYFTLAESLALAFLVTNVVKVFVGRKRPNFFAFCNYKGYRDALQSGNFTLYDSLTVAGHPGSLEYCLNTVSSDINQAQYSFPSGHSSFTFAGLSIALWFLLHCIPLGPVNKDVWTFRMWRSIPMAILLGTSTIIACTRTRDYWHNFSDILGGTFIGSACAIFVVFINSHARATGEQQSLQNDEEKEVV